MSDEKKDPGAKVVDTALRAAIVAGGGAMAAGSPNPMQAAVFGGVGGAAGIMLDLAIARARETSPELPAVLQRLFGYRLQSAAPQIKEKIEELREAVGEEEAVSTVIPNVVAYGKAVAEADGKKQRILMAALVSSFDPESYEAGMSRRFFGILDSLDYPEVRELMRCVQSVRKNGGAVSYSAHTVDSNSSLGDEPTTHRRRLGELGLLRVTGTASYSLTWLGVALVEFLERGGYNAVDPTPRDD